MPADNAARGMVDALNTDYLKYVTTNIVTDTLTMDANANNVADGWTLSTGAGTTGTTTVSADGQKLQITAATMVNGGSLSVYEDIILVNSAKAGDTITIAFDHKDEGDATGQLQVKYYDSSNFNIGTINEFFEAKSTFTTVQKQFVLPANTYKIIVYLMARVAQNKTGTIYYKNFKLDIKEGLKNTIAALKTDFAQFSAVTAAANTYTLNLAIGKNFAIETTDAPAKTIAFSNVPLDTGLLLQVSVRLKYTNAAAITHPVGTVWKDASTPTFAAGKQYLLLYTSYDNGTTWLASAVGAW